MTMTMTIKTILLNIKIIFDFHIIERRKNDVILDFMSGDYTWHRRIRLRTQTTCENAMSDINTISKLCPDITYNHIIKVVCIIPINKIPLRLQQ